MHRSRVHDYIDPIHTYIDTYHCVTCVMYFHSRPRLFNHLNHRSHICSLSVLLGGPLISAEDAREIVVALREDNRALYARGLRPYSAIKPVFRLSGPPPPPIIDPTRRSSHHLLGEGRLHYGRFLLSSSLLVY